MSESTPTTALDLATACVICNHNCGIRVAVEAGRITAIRPDETSPVTRGYMCNKGFSIPAYVEHAQRLTQPLRRQPDGSFEPVGWEEALDEIAARLCEIHARHGGSAIGAVGLGGQANHLGPQYLVPLLEALGSKRWFCAYAQEKTQHHLIEQWMFDAPPTQMFMSDAHHADTLFCIGSNPKVSNLMRNYREAMARFGQDGPCRLVVADPRVSDTARVAHRHLQLRPGSDVYLLLGMVAEIVQEDLVDHAFLERSTRGYDLVRESLTGVDVDEMASRCGIDPDLLRETAREFATAGRASVEAGLGSEQVRFSTLVSYLIRLLLALTNNAGRQGGNVWYGSFSPPVRNPDRHGEPPRALASGIQGVRALTPFHMFSPNLVPEEILADHAGRLRAIFVENANPFVNYADSARWRESRSRLELMVVLETAMTETARQADFVLPVPVSYAKWEYADFPRRYPEVVVHVRQPVLPPQPGERSEPEIYTAIAERMGLFGEPPAELFELAKNALSAEGAAAFFGTAQKCVEACGDPDPIPRLLYWTYHTLGRELPVPALVVVWLFAHLNALVRPAAVVRALGPDWKERSPFELGTEIFRRLIEHPEGAEIARLDPERGLEDNVGWDDAKVRLAPEPMLAEIRRALAELPSANAGFPFMWSAGVRTRWTANTIHRNPAWRKGRGPHGALRLSPGDARTLGVARGEPVRLTTSRGSLVFPVEIDPGIREGHVWSPNGFGTAYPGADPASIGRNNNELTDALDRDPITGCPHHKAIACRLEAVGH
jgi:anaerobic selenocysteine-containing dehydrogenase